MRSHVMPNNAMEQTLEMLISLLWDKAENRIS